MWEIKNLSPSPIETPISKIRFLPNQVLKFDMEILPKDVKRFVDKGQLEAVRVSTSLTTQIEIEKDLHRIADEIFLDWYI